MARARAAAWSLAAIAPLLRMEAAAQCLQSGVQYVGHQVILPGYVHSADMCQNECHMTFYCAFFTWHAAPNHTAGLIGPGGCEKFNDQATLELAPGPPENTISGPNACPETTAPPAVATAAPAGSMAAPTVLPTGFPTVLPPALPSTGSTPLPTALPLPSLAPGELPTGIPTGIPTAIPTGLPGAPAANVTAPGEVSGGGGWPWWATLLLLLLLGGIIAGVLFALGVCGGSKKKKSSKKQRKSLKEPRYSEQEATEVQALMHSEAPPPMSEPVAPQPMNNQQPLPAMQNAAGSVMGFQQPQLGSGFGSVAGFQPQAGSMMAVPQQGSVMAFPQQTQQVAYMQPQVVPAMQSQRMSVVQPLFR